MAVESSSLIVSGKLALVTGAASGIGRGICNVLAREGATIAAVDINKQGLEDVKRELPGGGHEIFVADVSSSSDVTTLCGDIKDIFKDRIPNVVVCCAGIADFKQIIDVTEDDYDRVLDVNLKGTFLVMQAMGRCMIENGAKDGSIIAITSVNAAVGVEFLSPYNASKAGQIALIKTAAKEWANIPIRCNAVSPGTINTAMSQALDAEHVQDAIGLTPMRRQGTPEEVAEVVLFLASDRSSFVAGANYTVGGGIYM